MDQSKSKITNTTATLMIGTAIFFDLLSIIPIVNLFVTFFTFMTFALWLMILGVGFISPKKLAAPVISVIVELIPAVSALPSITLMIVITISIIRAEEGKLGVVSKVVDPNVVNIARNKISRTTKPNVVTLSRKNAGEKIGTRELREKAA